MSRYREEGRVQQGSEFAYIVPKLTPGEVRALQTLLRTLPNREANYRIDGDQDNFILIRAVVHRIEPAGGTCAITGFRALDLDSQVRVILNSSASEDLVLANENAGSEDQNQIVTHTGSDITLGPNASVLIFYDRTSARVRTVGF